MSDYTWVMVDGQLVESGDSHLLDNRKHVETELFLKGDIA